jgi:hypothetical protein
VSPLGEHRRVCVCARAIPTRDRSRCGTGAERGVTLVVCVATSACRALVRRYLGLRVDDRPPRRADAFRKSVHGGASALRRVPARAGRCRRGPDVRRHGCGGNIFSLARRRRRSRCLCRLVRGASRLRPCPLAPSPMMSASPSSGEKTPTMWAYRVAGQAWSTTRPQLHRDHEGRP